MKKIIEDYKKIRSTPRGRALLFFGFYFVFFLVLIICLKNSPGNNDNNESIVNNNTPYSVESLKSDNYHFQYTIYLDNVKYIFDGKRNGLAEEFTYLNKNYYYNGDNYFVKEDTWLKTSNPYLYPEFLDRNNIIELINKAYLESDTKYQSGKHTYHYLVDINVLFETFFHEKTDYAGELDAMKVSINEDDVIDSIALQLNEYCKYDHLCQKTLRIELDYDLFNEIEVIKSPIV